MGIWKNITNADGKGGVRYREHPTRKHGATPDKYFVVTYWWKGKSHSESIGWASDGWTPTECFERLAIIKKNQRTGEGPCTMAELRQLAEDQKQEEVAQKENEAIENRTFGEFFDKYYYPTAKTDKKPESYRKEKGHYKHWLKPVLGRLPMKDIRPLHLERVKKNLLDAKRSPRTMEYVFATFRQCWNMARRDGLVTTESPSKQVKRPKINNSRLRFLSHKEADDLLAKLKDKSLQLHNMVLLSIHTGMRAAEVFKLRWGNVHEGHVDIIDAKGDKDRTAYLTEQVKAMFESTERGKPNDLVFPNRKGEQIDKISNSYFRAVDDLGLNDGVEDSKMKVVFHTCRHTFGSWHVEAGTDLYVLQKLMGHSTLAQTERYAHLRNKTLEEAKSKLEKSMAAAEQKTKSEKAVNMENYIE